MSDICVPEGTDWSCRFTDIELAAQDPVMIDIAEAFAWTTLAALSNYRIATCPIVMRPVPSPCRNVWDRPTYRAAVARGWNSAAVGFYGGPYITNGQWVNSCGCGVQHPPTVQLLGPVGSIVKVRVDGADLPRSAYRVMDGDKLIRLDGEPWPSTPDLTESDADGFSVTYYRGVRPNAMTKRAAGVLANEFLLACEGSDACRLPNNIKSLARSGESYEFAEKDYVNGDTGIPEVQAIIRIFNPHQLTSPVIVASPDFYPGAVPTWT